MLTRCQLLPIMCPNEARHTKQNGGVIMQKSIESVTNSGDSMAIVYVNGETLFRLESCGSSLVYSFTFTNGALVSVILDNDYRRVF